MQQAVAVKIGVGNIDEGILPAVVVAVFLHPAVQFQCVLRHGIQAVDPVRKISAGQRRIVAAGRSIVELESFQLHHFKFRVACQHRFHSKSAERRKARQHHQRQQACHHSLPYRHKVFSSCILHYLFIISPYLPFDNGFFLIFAIIMHIFVSSYRSPAPPKTFP